jgi:hypothetical protein
LRNTEMAQQRFRHARVFGGDYIYITQGIERALRDVAQITDRRGDHI